MNKIFSDNLRGGTFKKCSNSWCDVMNKIFSDNLRGGTFKKCSNSRCDIMNKIFSDNLRGGTFKKCSNSRCDIMKKFFLTICAAVIFFGPIVHAEEMPFVDNFIPWSENRDRLGDEYTLKHYGKVIREIVPQAVVVHWTAMGTLESNWKFFYGEDRGDGTLNVASQFICGRDGTMWRIMPETNFARHIIGYNHCAIGIENVGGYDHNEDLTDAQLAANVRLIKYLHAKYPTIKYVFGHYQQNAARVTGLYIENVAGYYSIKDDPGPIFMRGLREQLEADGLKFFDE